MLSPAERQALYGLPDFDDFQRAEFFAFTEAERALAERRKGPVEHLHCLLQIGYFKAKNAFFNFARKRCRPRTWPFWLNVTFPANSVTLQPLAEYEQYTQRAEIAKLFGYRLWSGTDRPTLVETAALLARRDVTPTFILIEILAFLKARKIVRPGYTTLQSIISDALTAERRRLGELIEEQFGRRHECRAAEAPGARGHTVRTGRAQAGRQEFRLSDDGRGATEARRAGTVASGRQETAATAGHLATEHRLLRKPRALLYDIRSAPDEARTMPSVFAVLRLASLQADHRQPRRRLRHHMTQIEQETKETAEQAMPRAGKRQQEAPRVGRVLLLYVDEAVNDATPFGSVRSRHSRSCRRRRC